MAKTKKEIENYVEKHKDDFVGTYKRDKKEYIYFYSKEGRFTGYIRRDKDSERAVKNLSGFKAKIKFKLKGKRGKKTITYRIYNLKQRDELLFRMNRNLRDKIPHKVQQRKRDLKDTKFREDSLPFKEGKSKIDLLFDKYKFKPVVIEEFKGASP